MRKTIIILALSMVAMLGILLTGCGGSSGGDGADLSDSQYVGTWKAVSMSIGDESEPYDETCNLILNGDGSGQIDDGADEVSPFTWELTDDGFKAKGDDVKMTFVDNGDGTISGKILGTRLNFERQ